jgi:hypothetical protein
MDPRRDRSGKQEVRILAEYPGLQVLQGRTRLDAELLHQGVSGPSVRLQSLGLATRPVQGQHDLGPQALPVGMLGDEGAELAHHLGVAPRGQVGLDTVLHGGQTKLLQTGDPGLSEWLVGELGQGRASPQAQGFPQDPGRFGGITRRQGPEPLGPETLEPAGIEVAILDLQDVPGCSGHQAGTLRAKSPAEPVHRGLEGVGGPAPLVFAPQLLHQAVGGDHLPGVDEEDGQQPPLPRSA